MTTKASSLKKIKSKVLKTIQKNSLQKYIVAKRFKSYLPEKSDFEIMEEVIPELKNNEFLVKSIFISVDPYLRSFANKEMVPYDQFGFQVGVVIKSNNEKYPIESYVVSHSGWRDYAILNGEPDPTFKIKPYIPSYGRLTLSMTIGALGMTGIAAHLGLTEILNVKNDEVVCVTSAAGEVGSIAVQIAKLKGCTVIGLCNSDEKVRILKEDFGIQHAINYRTESDIPGRLKTAAPEGINCFFDNGSGQLAEKIYECMHENGRIAVCGATNTYGYTKTKDRYIISKSDCEIEAFSFNHWSWDKQEKAMKELRTWIENGDIIVRETVRVGFKFLPEALISCLNGEHIGKSLVQCAKEIDY